MQLEEKPDLRTIQIQHTDRMNVLGIPPLNIENMVKLISARGFSYPAEMAVKEA